jgi:prepilin-type N-terminal cleavage/methylation domain-containing protein
MMGDNFLVLLAFTESDSHRRHRVTQRVSPRVTLGFTLVELLVVIAIIGMLVGLLLPAVQVARESARRTSCANRLREMSTAVLNYESSNGRLPHGSMAYTSAAGTATAPAQSTGWTWMYFILPYMEELKLYNDGAMQTGETVYNAQRGYRLRNSTAPWLRCPSDGYKAANFQNLSNSNYAACGGPKGGPQPSVAACTWPDPYSGFRAEVGASGGWGGAGNWDFSTTRAHILGMFVGFMVDETTTTESKMMVKLKDVSDGLSKTIMLGETGTSYYRRNCCRSGANGQGNAFGDADGWLPASNGFPINYTKPDETGGPVGCEDGQWAYSNGFKSMHASGANLSFGDGTVKFVNENVNMSVYVRMGHKSDAKTYEYSE